MANLGLFPVADGKYVRSDLLRKGVVQLGGRRNVLPITSPFYGHI